MKISAYNVTLTRLTEDKIELIRQWRNDPKISQYMEYREHITAEMQLNWFRKIDNENNYYFIIEFEGKEIGLANLRDIDYEKKEGEGGIFIYDDSMLNSTVSFQAVLAINDFSFERLNLDRILIHVLKNNKRAILFNKALGYVRVDTDEDVENEPYVLEKEVYYKKRNSLINLIQ
ncbi:GNAT family N-acetyltransferase [Dysgonomonas massiliensis]|uniref:GNAT family N-acetyltransferase n=1 Tax=Dysgonomonas massiliensis TaxID=2040292 RepID=UPI000C7682A4|nr:GNAT family N-acetyltransferase [Dysgonomonas massiliensis]